MSTQVIESSEYISKNAKNVFVLEEGCYSAAETVYQSMLNQNYSTETWSSHPLNPKEKTSKTVDWIFTVDLLNFSFWSNLDDNDSGLPSSQRYSVEYKTQLYTGYWSLAAAINKALDQGIKITSPEFWASSDFTIDVLQNVFRSETLEQVPLLQERFNVLKEAGKVITQVCNRLKYYYYC